MYRFVANKKYINLLIAIEEGEKKIRQLCKRVDMSYFHLTNVLQQWQKEGVIDRTRDQNSLNITLTEKGKRIVKALLDFKTAVEEEPEKEEEEQEIRAGEIETEPLDIEKERKKMNRKALTGEVETEEEVKREEKSEVKNESNPESNTIQS